MHCLLCSRTSEDSHYFEDHHLLPGKQRRTFQKRKDDVILVCRDCGDQIHLMFNNTEIRSELDSLEALQVAMSDFIEWVQRRPIECKVSMKRKKRKL
jgi:hypothetical protein